MTSGDSHDIVRVGVIGCGNIACVRHIPEYLANPHATIVGYCNRTPERAQELAEAHGGRAYITVDELLDDPSIDAVSICTSNATHAPYAIKALETGKHVLVEKPLATSIEDCEAMVARARATGRTLMVCQNQRLERAHLSARHLVRSGAIGHVLTFRTSFGHSGPETWSVGGKRPWFFDANEASMGAMGDLGVHKTDLIQFLLGTHVAAVTARFATLDKESSSGEPIGVEDNALCIYEMSDGAMGTLCASWTRYGEEENATTLYGTKGVMRINSAADLPLRITETDGAQRAYRYEELPLAPEDEGAGWSVIDAFVRAIVRDERPPIDAEDVLPAMRAVFAAAESNRLGRRVTVCPAAIPASPLRAGRERG